MPPSERELSPWPDRRARQARPVVLFFGLSARRAAQPGFQPLLEGIEPLDSVNVAPTALAF
ncbi:hypothetical protein RA210_U10443 [Rubrivivax sp. A210]|nr:hypothetical protein RA210_U10443 [Rubrivivax sp. A210]